MSEQQVPERAAIEPAQLVMPFYLICDVSSSMQGDMPALNDAVRRLRRAIAAEPAADDVVEVCMMTFSDTGKVAMPLRQMSESEVPALAVESGTRYGVAFHSLTQTNEQDTASRKGQEYKIYRPCAFFLTDGEPSDSDWRTVGAVTDKRLNGQGAGTPSPESHGVYMDQSFKDLLEASSLGTPAARRIRSSTPSEVVDDVRLRMGHRRERSPSHAAAAHDRLVALRRDEAALRARIEDETARGARQHYRLNYRFGTALAVALALLDALPVYWSAQAFGLSQTSTIILTILLCAALGGAMWLLDLFHREDRRSALRILEGVLSAGFVAMFVLRLDYLHVTGGAGIWSAALEALALTAISAALVAVGFVVLSRRAPKALASAERPPRQAAAPKTASALAAFEDTAVTWPGSHQSAGTGHEPSPRAVGQAVAADQIIAAKRALPQGAGPSKEPTTNPDGRDSNVGYVRKADKRGRRQARGIRPRLRLSTLTGAIALAAVAVMAFAVAGAATVFGLRFSVASQPAVSVVIVATATANEPAPTLSADTLQMLRSAAYSSDPAAAYIVSPSHRQPTVLPLTPRRPDGQVNYGPTRAETLAANVSAVTRALENEAAAGPLDLLATIAAAVRTTFTPSTLIVVSSGLSTAGAFNLLQVGWGTDPSSLAAQLKAQGALPDLAGWRVVFSGLGDVAGRQPALPVPQQATLAAYWTTICQAAGAASCTVDKTARPQLASHVTSSTPIVPVPVVAAEQGPGGRLITSLPDTLLFQLGSTTLNSYADTILQPIVQQARSRHLLASITGYASPDGGTTAYNLALSKRRANAVRSRLIALGLPAGQITQFMGAGTDGIGPNACMVNGHMDEAICAQMRRVVIVLSPAKANP